MDAALHTKMGSSEAVLMKSAVTMENADESCKLSPPDECLSESVFESENTYYSYEIKAEDLYYCVIWTLNGFNLLPFTKKHPVSGAIFYMGKNRSCLWQLQMMKEKDGDGAGCIAFRLVKTEGESDWECAEFIVHLETDDGRSLKCADWVVGKSLKNSFIFHRDDDSDEGEASLSEILSKDKVSVVCKVRFIYNIELPVETQAVSDERRLCEDFKNLYNTPKFYDVILCTSTREFPVHRNILSVRSYCFDKMLQEDKNVRTSRKLNLDIDPLIADYLIAYLYSGDFAETMSVENAYALWIAARRFRITHLISRCVDYLLKHFRGKYDFCEKCRVRRALSENEETYKDSNVTQVWRVDCIINDPKDKPEGEDESCDEETGDKKPEDESCDEETGDKKPEDESV